VLDHGPLDPPLRLGRNPPTEDDVIANTELLRSIDDPRRLEPGGIGRRARVADRTGAEHPERKLGQLVTMLAQEMLGVSAPALHVHGAPEHDRVAGGEIPHVLGRLAIDLVPGLTQDLGDGLGDLGRRAAFGGMGNENVRDETKSPPPAGPVQPYP